MIILYLVLSICVFIVLQSGILGLLSEEETSTVFNMMIMKKFQKDLKSLSIQNRIFKRKFFIVFSENKSLTEKGLIKNGCTKKEAVIISNHPMVLSKTTDGEAVVSNLTHSCSVNGKETTHVGDGSFFVNEVKKVNPEMYKMCIHYGIDVEVSQVAAINIAKAMERIIGKELLNKNIESVKSINKGPIDKL